MNIRFFLNSFLLGVGLAVDAFSVSCANALREPKMRVVRMTFIAGVYGLFQFLMPLIGWICVHTIEENFKAVQGVIPWIALVLLVWIGGKMLLEGIRECRSGVGETAGTRADTGDLSAKAEADGIPAKAGSNNRTAEAGPEEKTADAGLNSRSAEAGAVLTLPVLLLQGIATSIDALSVGFAIVDYTMQMAIASCIIIGLVTFVICMGGLSIGKKAGTLLTGKADLLGGIILILIGFLNLVK